MRKFLTGLVVIVLVVGGAITVFWPVNFWRLFDANMQPLALTQVEAYCVGYEGLGSNFQEHDPEVTACRIANPDKGVVPDVALTPRWFCEGLQNAGWPGFADECIGIMDGQELWPLLEGGITWEWNPAHPRPSIPTQVIIDPVRDNVRDNSTNRGDIVVP